MTTTERMRGERIAGLDGLRALACLMVFAVHFGQISGVAGSFGPLDLQRLLANGNSGVALFFALSGYLLSLPYWRAGAGQSAPVSTGGYLVRRAARILPAYYLCLTALVVKNQLWRESGGWADIGLHYLMLLNVGDSAIFRINPPFWTIAVEFQFYLLLPLLFVALSRLGHRARIAALGVFCVGCYVAYAWLGEALYPSQASATTDPAAGSRDAVSPVFTYSLLAHLPHFLIGVIAAGWRGQPRAAADPAPAGAGLVFWSCLSGVAIVLATPFDELLRIPWGRYNLPYVPLMLLALVITAPLSASARSVFDSRAMRALGAISYGVYIYHLPVLNLLSRTMPRAALDARENWLVFGALGLAATLVIAAASHRLIEQPIVRFVRSWSARVKAPIHASARRPVP